MEENEQVFSNLAGMISSGIIAHDIYLPIIVEIDDIRSSSEEELLAPADAAELNGALEQMIYNITLWRQWLRYATIELGCNKYSLEYLVDQLIVSLFSLKRYPGEAPIMVSTFSSLIVFASEDARAWLERYTRPDLWQQLVELASIDGSEEDAAAPSATEQEVASRPVATSQDAASDPVATLEQEPDSSATKQEATPTPAEIHPESLG